MEAKPCVRAVQGSVEVWYSVWVWVGWRRRGEVRAVDGIGGDVCLGFTGLNPVRSQTGMLVNRVAMWPLVRQSVKSDSNFGWERRERQTSGLSPAWYQQSHDHDDQEPRRIEKEGEILGESLISGDAWPCPDRRYERFRQSRSP